MPTFSILPSKDTKTYVICNYHHFVGGSFFFFFNFILEYVLERESPRDKNLSLPVRLFVIQFSCLVSVVRNLITDCHWSSDLCWGNLCSSVSFQSWSHLSLLQINRERDWLQGRDPSVFLCPLCPKVIAA